MKLMKVTTPHQKATISAAESLTKKIIGEAPLELQSSLNHLFKLIGEVNKVTPIFDLASQVRLSLGHFATDPEQDASLGAATAFGWGAYTVLDNYLDNEGEEAFLPAAIFSLRAMHTLFSEAVEGSAFQKEVQRLLLRIDTANA